MVNLWLCALIQHATSATESVPRAMLTSSVPHLNFCSSKSDVLTGCLIIKDQWWIFCAVFTGTGGGANMEVSHSRWWREPNTENWKLLCWVRLCASRRKCLTYDALTTNIHLTRLEMAESVSRWLQGWKLCVLSLCHNFTPAHTHAEFVRVPNHASEYMQHAKSLFAWEDCQTYGLVYTNTSQLTRL